MNRLKQYKNTLSTPLVFVFLFLLNCFFTRNFASWYTVRSILTQSTSLVLVAIGTTFVIAVGGIDISLGSGFAWNAVLFSLVLRSTESLAVSFIVVLFSAFVIGMILITLVVTVPGLHNIFKVQTLTLSQLLTVYGLAALNLPIIQMIKAVRAKFRK